LNEIDLHLISMVFIFVASVIPIYLISGLKNSPLRKLTLVLTVFILIHGFYHVTGFLGFNFVAEGILEPLSILILIFFGMMYLNTIRTKREKIKV
jgi:hypothetical protein